MCPVEAPSLWTLYINLFKKQEVISVPLYREEVRVLHHWNSYKPLHRDIPLTGKSSERPCKPDRPTCDLLLSSSSRSGQQQFATWVITAKSSHQKWWLFKMERKDTTGSSEGEVSVGETGKLATAPCSPPRQVPPNPLSWYVRAGTTSMQETWHGRMTSKWPEVGRKS